MALFEAYSSQLTRTITLEMNSIRQIQELNRRELENGVLVTQSHHEAVKSKHKSDIKHCRSPEASWHADYRDTAYIYIGGLPFELSEGDISTIFSQYGEPTFVELVRDKETGKSKGFAFLKYEDQRSTDLAVDNLGGVTIMKRTLRVDHTSYKKKDEKPEILQREEAGTAADRVIEPQRPARPMLKEERELMALMENHDDDDPMKDYLIQEKKEEIAAALARGKDSGRNRKDGHRRHHRRGDSRSLNLAGRRRDCDTRSRSPERRRRHSPNPEKRHSRRYSRSQSAERQDHSLRNVDDHNPQRRSEAYSSPEKYKREHRRDDRHKYDSKYER